MTKVWVNKPIGWNLWSFEPTIDDSDAPILKVDQYRHLDELSAAPVATWHVEGNLPDNELIWALADLVGMRTAKAAVARLHS